MELVTAMINGHEGKSNGFLQQNLGKTGMDYVYSDAVNSRP